MKAPESFAVAGRPVQVSWRRSAQARRISLRIEPRAGGVIVTLPTRASVAAGMALLTAHRDWVVERLARLPVVARLGDGATVPIDGVPVPIVHRPDLRGSPLLQDGALHVGGDGAFVARRVTDWLRVRARRTLGELARAKANAAGLRVARVVIKDTSSRWGSCTSTGTLMFSWRLVMAPAAVQDYVVGHEVAHLRHMDHGKAFWTLAAQLTPHRAAADAWLAAHGAGLMRIG